MRTSIGILLLFAIVYSCKPRLISVSNGDNLDSVKFTYIYSEALKNKMLGQSKLATKQFIECLEMNPESTASAYQICDLFLESGDVELAKTYSERCLKYKPDNEWYLLQRVNIAKRLNEKQVYEKIYTKLSQKFPQNLNYIYEYSIILFENKRFDEALTNLQTLEDEVGVNENISFLRNNIYFALNRLDAIQLELLRLRKAYPDSTRYSDMLAEFYLSYNQPEKALSLYQSVIEIDKDNGFANLGIAWIQGNLGKLIIGYPSLMIGLKNTTIPFERKFKVAEIYLNSSNNSLSDDSISNIYESWLAVDNNSMILNKYISFLFDLKNYKLAEKYAKKSVEQNPDNFIAWEILFNTLMLQSRNEELKNYSLKALEYFPNHALVFFFSGYSQYALKQYNEAINYFEIGIDYVGDNLNLEKQFLVYLAESYHYIANNKQSDIYFEKYIEIDSTNAFVMNNYAFYLTLRKVNIEKALSLSRKCIEIDPFNSSFLDTYAWVLFSLNDLDKSINYIERAYKYGGNTSPIIVEHFGDILFKKNRVDEALEKWKEAYSLNRTNIKLLEKINNTELEN